MTTLRFRLIFATALLAASAPAQTVVLSDNLDMLGFGSEFASTTERLTVPFVTDAQTYDLSTVVLYMNQLGSGANGAVLEIWTGATEPSVLLGTLTTPPVIPGGKSNVTFTANGITLEPLSIYWVVLRSTEAATDYAWGWAAGSTGAGVGFTGWWGRSIDAGATWSVFFGAPMRMKVTADVSSWTDAGPGLPGLAGVPDLSGTGSLLATTAGVVALESAAPSAPAVLFVSLSQAAQPFKGGTLVPAAPWVAVPMVTDTGGEAALAWTDWPAGLSGATLFLQAAVLDAAAVKGVALSNALSADVP